MFNFQFQDMIFAAILFSSLLALTTGFWHLSDIRDEHFWNSTYSCARVPGLTTKQRDICIKNPDTMKHFVEGLHSAIDECQQVFKDEVWNCTVLRGAVSPFRVGSKETAYLYAIAAAGTSQSLARACSKGLISDCGCGPVPSSTEKNFMWAGCSDNVRYGNGFGRKFMDYSDKIHKDTRSLMNLHNNRVGRRLLANNMKKQCKCHGVSGSCVTKTCWKVVPRLDEFALLLKKKYDYAQQVTTGNEDTLLLRQSKSEGGRSERYLKNVDVKATRTDLVYLNASPDFCHTGDGKKVPTKGRECGTNCSEVCCGNGWHTVREMLDEPCHCQFIWCCEVKCQSCKKIRERNFCK